MNDQPNQLEILTSEIFQRMAVRDARQDRLNRVLSVISTAAIITASLSFLVTIYVFFGRDLIRIWSVTTQ